MREHPGIAPPRDPAAELERIGLYRAVPGIVAGWLADPFPPAHMTVGEARLPMRADAGVSCATGHMPVTEGRETVAANHNQNDTLCPNDKMIRPVCLDCRGLQFYFDALADADLVDRNFRGVPAVRLDRVEWAVRRSAADERGAAR